MVNFDLISQAREKMGLSVNRLNFMKDLTPNIVGVAEKDFVRISWRYFDIGSDFVKYAKGKKVPTDILCRAWHTKSNVNHYFIYEDQDGKTRCLNFNGYKSSPIDPRSLDERVEGRDIKAYNDGAKPKADMLLVGVAVLTLALGLVCGILLGPSVLGALNL